MCFRSPRMCHNNLLSMTTIYNFCPLFGLADDSIHLFLSSTFFVLTQVFVTSSDSPVVWCGQTSTFWPTTWWLEILPIPSTSPVSISMISCQAINLFILKSWKQKNKNNNLPAWLLFGWLPCSHLENYAKFFLAYTKYSKW